jgi:hypothetical protein
MRSLDCEAEYRNARANLRQMLAGRQINEN